MLTTADTGKIRRGFGKNAGEWTGRVEINKEEIPGSKRSLYCYILTTPGFTGRTFKLCVLTRWDLISVSAAPYCRSIVDHSINLSIPDLKKKKYQKGMNRNNKK